MADATDDNAEIIFNDMRVRVAVVGPRHYVQATIQGVEPWMVDHRIIEVEPGDVVGFLASEDAAHFISQARAIDLGVWNTLKELQDAYVEAMARHKAEPARRGPGRPRKEQAA